MSKNTGKFFLAGLLGAVTGAIGGLLFAPKSGEETRQDILKLANKLVKAVKTEVEDTEDRVVEVFGEATKTAKDKYKEITGKVMEKVAAVKSAGEEIDKEIAENKKEVKRYIDHLEQFEKAVFTEITQLKQEIQKIKETIIPVGLTKTRPVIKLKPKVEYSH